MQYSTSHQKPPVYSHNETSKLSADISKPSPRSMYSSATQGKKFDESRNISIGAAETEQVREKAKYPIKIPVEQMKVQKSQPIRNRPASAKAQKKNADENFEKSSNMSSRKGKNPSSKREYTNEDFQTTESNRERVARPKSAKPQKSGVRPMSSRGPKKGADNKRRQNISIDQGKDDQRVSKLSEVYQQELRDYDESRKNFAERARQLMMENLMKYQEEMRKHEEMTRHKKEEKELKKTKEVEKAKEVHERAQKNQTELRASRTRKSDRFSENKVVEPKQERKEQSRKVEKVEKEEPLRGLAKKKEEMAIAYGMEEYHTGKSRKQKAHNDWDDEVNENKEKYNIKKKEKAPEEKEKLKRLVHEQFEKKKKEQMDQKTAAQLEKDKKKQRLDALMRSVEEMQHKEGGGKHLGHTIKTKSDLSETVKPKRKPFQPIDENIQSHQTYEEIDDSDHYQTREHEEVEEHDDEVQEHDENYEHEEEEENQEMEEFERLEHEVVGDDHDEEREEEEENYENMDSAEKEAQVYSLEPLEEITNSNNNTSQKKFSEEKRSQKGYFEKGKADKKLDFEIEDEGDKENVNKQNYELRRTEEKQKENKKKPFSVKKDEKKEGEQNEGEELDFDDMLFTMSSEQLMKLPYFSLAK